MKKALWSALAVSTLFALFGCNNRSETQVLQPTQNEELKPMQQSWRGVLPCADCEGIETSLFLQKDGTWVMNQRYQGAKEPSSFATYGTWARTAEKLVLTDTSGEKTYFRAKGEGMEMLDREGNPIESQFNYTLAPVKAALPATPMPMRGMYFYMADAAIFTDCATGKKVSVANNAQLERFMTAIQEDKVWHDFFYTELTTGLRRGEICGLMWQDFDEKAGTLKILRSVNVPKAGELEIGETKTSQGRRTIRLPPSTVQRLKERRKHAVSQWIFPEPLAPEKPVRPSAAYYWMKRILREAGLPAIRFHDLRHTFATHALTSGVDAKTLSGILGHTSASFTLDTYTHTTGDMQKRAAEIVGGFLTDYLGEEMAPWQSAENAGTAAST